MLIKGFQPLSLLDYPGKLSAIVFLFGCNLRCGYCHNPGLVVKGEGCSFVSKEKFFSFLDSRVNLLEGVVITGGEPCLNADLPEFAREIKRKGFAVKLDSNGFNPTMLRLMAEEKLVDYIAMDVKAPLEKYRRVTHSLVDVEKIAESIEFVKTCGVRHEFRTTVVPTLLDESDLEEIGRLVEGADAFYLQQYSNKITLDPAFSKVAPYSRDFFLKMRERLSYCAKTVGVRGLA